MKFKVIVILVVIFIIAGEVVCYNDLYKSTDYTHKIHSEEIGEDKSEDKNEEYDEKEIYNLLLLGIDKEENASDSIVILSINKKNKTIKLVSIMRDIYVYQGENMVNKINYAYHYGGIQGSIDTLNKIFNLDISKYIKVDFEGLVSIVDNLNGIEVNINEAERKSINITCDKYFINNSGKVRLNGEQALAFSRIRKIDSDFERTQRQRKVLTQIFSKVREVDSFEYPKIIYKLYKISDTNLSISDIMSACDMAYKTEKGSIKELRIPIDGTWKHSSSGPYHLDWDEERNKQALNDFIYK